MRMPTTVSAVEEFTDNGLLCQSSQRERRDEFLSGRGHHNLHFCTFLDEKSGEDAGFVGGYATCYSKYYLFIFQHTLAQVVRGFVLYSS